MTRGPARRSASRASARLRGGGSGARAGAADAPIVDAVVDRIGGQGDGVAETSVGRLYLPYTAPGDHVRARRTDPRGDGFAGEVVEWLAQSPDRARPPCRHFGRCGGCALQHLNDDAYAAWKRGRATQAARRAGFDAALVGPLARCRAGDRRRALFAATGGAPGRAASLGFFARRGAAVVDLEECPVLRRDLADATPAIRLLAGELLAPGETARVAVAVLDHGLDLVFERARPLTLAERATLAGWARDAGIARASWRGEEAAAEPVAALRPATTRFGGIEASPPPGGFLQAVAAAEAAMIAEVTAAVGGRRAVVDLFAGAGTFALPLAAGGASVRAVDADATALATLSAAARALGASPAGGSAGRISVETRDLMRRPLLGRELDAFDAAVLDPPRAGAAAQAQALAESDSGGRLGVIAYVSCNPETFARDAATLRQGGWRLVGLTPVDQFLWSPHLELVGAFRR